MAKNNKEFKQNEQRKRNKDNENQEIKNVEFANEFLDEKEFEEENLNKNKRR